jgi:hypothetical protein
MLIGFLMVFLALVALALVLRLLQLQRLLNRMALLPAERPSLITIEILNPFELAQKQSRLAGTFGVLAPSLLRQEVLRQAVARIRQQLEAEGVQAEVRLVRGA